jgi:hypothetical protein
MKIENVKVFGIIDALRGMRNPLNSWAKNDSKCVCSSTDGSVLSVDIGPNDEKLCMALCYGGQPHRKFLRQIPVIMDITAPTYWWAEMDTYKVASTRNSCSVQHKGASRDFTIDDFTVDKTSSDIENLEIESDAKTIISIINKWRRKYVETNDYTYFRLMRQFLSAGYDYKTTWSSNYETLLNIYEWRKNHRLKEWHVFCKMIEELPGMNIFIKHLTKEVKNEKV